MLFGFGEELSAASMGLLFAAIGSSLTLFYYSIATAIIFVLFMAYIFGNKHLDDYEKVPESGSEDDE